MDNGTVTAERSIFDRPVDVPEELRQAARDKGWPDGLLERALELRMARADIDFWLTRDRHTVEDIQKHLDRKERLMFGTIRVREATWNDDEAVVELYANSPEEIGDWEVTVERSPYPFAQFRLQERANIQVLEDRGVLLSVWAHSVRNTFVGGKRISVHVSSAMRVRKECRGQGYSHLIRMAAGPACTWYGMGNFYYIRSQNFGAFDWIKSINPEAVASEPERAGDVPGRSVTVHYFPKRPFDGDASGIRLARRSDTRRCMRLINRTHRGLDLFRPYSEEYLQGKLDDPCWGPKPQFWPAVYGWQDYYVLQEGGRIVACAGLWDKGKHVREVWRHKVSGERRVIESTALLDFGYADGREDAMARLIGYLIGVTDDLGRDHLMASLEFLPSLAERLETYEPVAETRALHWQMEDERGEPVDVKLARPYTDLAYW